MNPNQLPGSQNPGGSSLPPASPVSGSISDIPEDGFGFADEPRQPPQVQPVMPQPVVALPAAPMQSFTARPAPQLTPPIRPPQQIPAPAPISEPTPAPAIPPTPVIPPVPPAMMPPQQVPTVPTPPAAPAPTLPPPTPVAVAPAPAPASETFDPSRVPVHASSTSENPITATFTPQPTNNHLPSDIAQRINEKPMQNSGDIMRQIKHGLNGSRLKSILSFITFTASIFVAAFLINQFVFQSYYVEGTSMTPTLQNNDRLIISKVERTIAGIQGHSYIPERGQIVVLDSSIIGLNGQHEQLIKRVIGLPGDHIHIEAGTVTITNTKHPDGYDVTRDLGLTNLLPTYTDTPIDVTVPEGQVYVMGDNREQGGSYDSRSFGPIDGNQIQGRLWGRVLPLESARLY